MTVNKNYYGYARVSTVQQDLGVQVNALIAAGVPEENIFSEKMSGKSAKNRLEWIKLKEKLQPGDVVFVHKLDRLGRSIVDVFSIIEEFKEMGIYLVIMDAKVDTRLLENGSEMDKLQSEIMLTVLNLVARMERTFIVERTKPAIENAKKNGVKFGRPESNKKLYEKAVEEFIEANGEKSANEVLKPYGNTLTTATFFRRLKEYRDHSEAVLQLVESKGKKTIDDIIKEYGGKWSKDGKKFTPTLNEKTFKHHIAKYEKENGVKL